MSSTGEAGVQQPKKELSPNAFSRFCNLCEGRNKDLRKIFEKRNPRTLWAFIYLLCPEMDPRSYGLGEASLVQVVKIALGLPKDSATAKRLDKYDDEAMHVAEFLSSILAARNDCGTEAKMSMEDANAFLDHLASIRATGGSGTMKEQAAVLSMYMQCFTAREWKWIFRLVLKDLDVGITELAILDAIHPDARDLYAVNHRNIRKVCELLPQDPAQRVPESQKIPVLHTPFLPQLAERLVSMDQMKRMFGGGKPFYIEKKMDGERIQYHAGMSARKMFSRNGTDYTALYGSLGLQISLHKLIRCKKCILDCEIVAWHTRERRYLPFGTLKTVATYINGRAPGTCRNPNMDEDCRHAQLCLVVFDILRIDEESLVHLPLSERLARMRQVLAFKEGLFEEVHREEATSIERVIQRIHELGPGEEGVVVKLPDARYVVGEREGAGWLKVKPEDLADGVDTFDCLIVGGTRCGHFVVAVMDPYDEEGKPRIFRSFCKVTSGLSRQDSQVLREYLRSRSSQGYRLFKAARAEKLTDTTRGVHREWGYVVRWPENIEVYFSSDPDAKLDWVCNPATSKIVEVMGDRRWIHSKKVMAGLSYPGCPVPIDGDIWSWALRFARIGPKGIRDIHWTECMVQKQLWDSVAKCMAVPGAAGPVVSSEAQRTLADARREAKRAATHHAGHIPKKHRPVLGTVPAHIAATEKRWDLLAGCFVVVLDNAVLDRERHDVIRKAKEMGAPSVRILPGDETTHVISFGTENLRFESVKREQRWDVLHPSWIHDCYELAQRTDGACELVPHLQSKYLVYARPETEARLRGQEP